MSTPSVIPRPTRLRMRDFIQRGGPVVATIIVLSVIALFWRADLFPTNFVGEAQAPTSTLASPEVGRLVHVLVQPYDLVTNGQVLGRVAIKSDESLQATLAALTADLEVLHVRMLQDQERNDLNYVQLRHDLLLRRIELTAARIRLRQAEGEFERARVLYEQKLLAAGVGLDLDGYEVALRDRDLYRSEVQDKEQLVSQMEEAIRLLRPPDKPDPRERVRSAIEAAISAQEKQLRETEGPSILRAPISGMVMRIYRNAGENVAQNEPLFDVRATRPEWILGFIRQPISSEPAVGDSIEVRSRGLPRQTGTARVLKVGAYLELFSQPLRVRGFDASQERGLPVLLSFPENMRLHPGELVDLERIGH